jgi:hypothetical protein
LIIVSTMSGRFWKPGKLFERSEFLPGFQERPDAACSLYGFGGNDDQGL